ncbi:MAG: aryl-sulfate sulfotransferase [Isosphaeraceae bacterium]
MRQHPPTFAVARPARHTRSIRPICAPLEERVLLSVALRASKPTVSPVGAPITWTAKARGHGASPVYQFVVDSPDGRSSMVRDFSSDRSFTWSPMGEGNYVVRVIAKDGYSATDGESASVAHRARPRARSVQAVVNRLSNPLVALYSAPASSSDGSLRVEFKPAGTARPWTSTSAQEVMAGRSTNVIVAGLLPNTNYLMRHVSAGGLVSPARQFRTGTLPGYLSFPTFAVQKPEAARSGLDRQLVLHIGVNPPPGTVNTVATNLSGNIVWYYDPVTNGFPGYAPTLVNGGTVLMLGGKQDGVGGADTLREIDLAGNGLRETNIRAVNSQLAAMGLPSIDDFNHEARRLPDGRTAVLSTSARTIVVNGKPTLYKGDMILVLDQDFRVAWAWDPFRWLDTNRLPTGGEKTTDWTHGNSIAWSPTDGNLIVSMRSQDWVLKINYDRGAGDGHVVWRLGEGGDFAIQSSVRSPWFTHQHDARYIDDTTLALFDNGNTRQATLPGSNSRGQVLALDERNMLATLTLNADMGNYAPAVGSSQRLPDGSLAFNSGFAQQTIVVRPDGSKLYVQKMNMPGLQYRSYIYSTLYDNPTDFLG